MALEPITTSGPTITVSTAEELKAAYDLLANQAGGGTILLEAGDYNAFVLNATNTPGGDEPVIIKSLDADDPAATPRLVTRWA